MRRGRNAKVDKRSEWEEEETEEEQRKGREGRGIVTYFLSIRSGDEMQHHRLLSIQLHATRR